MQFSSTDYLRYLRASLADAACLSPKLKSAVPVERSCLTAGVLDAQSKNRLFELRNKLLATVNRKKGVASAEADESPAYVIVCPWVYELVGDHGYADRQLPAQIVPVVIFAKLYPEGHLAPDEMHHLSIIPREYLESTSSPIAIGTVEDADKAYALASECATWSETLLSARAVLRQVTGLEPETLRLSSYELAPNALLHVQGVSFVAGHVIDLVDQTLSVAPRKFPLFDAVLSEVDVRPLMSSREQLSQSAQHLGQMESRYPLSQSQRESLLHVLTHPGSGGRLLAVDGPPGTGKTTLLLSVIATRWVTAALEGADAPLVVASSTNNQAVVNVLEAFARTVDKQGPFSGRWLPGIESFGLYMPAKSRDPLTSKPFRVHELRGKGLHAIHDAQRFESVEGFAEAEREFLAKCAIAFQVAEVQDARHAADLIGKALTAGADRSGVAVLHAGQASAHRWRCGSIAADLETAGIGG